MIAEPRATERSSPAPSPVRMVIADRHPVLLAGLIDYFSRGAAGFEVIAVAGTLGDLERLVRRTRPDLTVLGDSFGEQGFFEVVTRCSVWTRLVVVGGDGPPGPDGAWVCEPGRVVTSGAAGYVSRRAELVHVETVLRAVAAGDAVFALPPG